MRRFLLAGVALAPLTIFAVPAFADDAAILRQLEQMQQRLDAQEKSIDDQKTEIAKLKAQLAAAKPAPAVTAAKTAAPPANVTELAQTVMRQQTQIDGLVTQQKQAKIKAAEAPSFTLANGRPSFTTASGNFTAALRSIVQFDSAYYMQNSGAPSPNSDLNSGTNFRRARLGVAGKLANVWEYNFTYDFGGSGTEGSTISAAYLQYNGLGPIQIRAGAFAPYASLEDSEGAGDSVFLERASAVEIARGIAGGDGRSAVAVQSIGSSYLASIAYTGGKVGQAGTFDEQQGVLGRFAYMPFSTEDSTAVIGVNGTYVFDPADAAAGSGSASTGINFQNSPELRVDNTGLTAGTPNNQSTNLVSTGNINARTAAQWGVDAGANWNSLYAEGGYYHFSADRRTSVIDPSFSGWYAEASWVLTGEPRRYDSTSAAFKSPRVTNPVNGALGGWGAWELAARYSTIDLNYRDGVAGSATPSGGVRGGEQNIWTFGLNWYPTDALRVLLNYQRDEIDRLDPAGAQIGQDLDAVSLRLQVQY